MHLGSISILYLKYSRLFDALNSKLFSFLREGMSDVQKSYVLQREAKIYLDSGQVAFLPLI